MVAFSKTLFRSNLAKKPGLLGLIFRKAQNKVQDPAKLRRLIADLIDKEEWPFRDALLSVLSLDDVLVEALIIGLPFGIVYGLKANGNGAMNSGGDMSSKTGSIGNQNL